MFCNFDLIKFTNSSSNLLTITLFCYMNSSKQNLVLLMRLKDMRCGRLHTRNKNDESENEVVREIVAKLVKATNSIHYTYIITFL